MTGYLNYLNFYLTNMREIKFRAWDKEERIMGKVKVLTDEGCFIEGNSPSEDKVYGELIVYGTADGHFVYMKDLELMQYTGLKDKNGNEIYSGDILATSNNDERYDLWEKDDNEYTVVEEMEYELGVGYSNWSLETLNPNESIFGICFVEVIGNIYENPNLLK